MADGDFCLWLRRSGYCDYRGDKQGVTASDMCEPNVTRHGSWQRVLGGFGCRMVLVVAVVVAVA